MSEEAQLPVEDINEQIRLRHEKLLKMREEGNAYPNDYVRNQYAQTLHQMYNDLDAETLESKHIEVALAGRMMTRRLMGKASFLNLQDMSGRIQIYLKQSDLAEGAYESFKHWDLGDILGVRGVVFKTKTGELSVKATEIKLLTKALKPLPDKYHGLTDQEACYRQRYLDLLVNEKSRQTFMMRTKIIQSMREFLNHHQYIEVETPMMQAIPGGAAARPFKTHHNALDMEMYLRIAPELYLKRLVVGGFERVFEINRNFRNEGISTRHNPEFTMLEFYCAYDTYIELMDFTEKMLRHIAQDVLGTTKLQYAGHDYDLSQPFRRMSIKESLLHYNKDMNAAMLEDKAQLTKYAQGLKIDVSSEWGLGKIQLEIFENTVESQLIQPTFITEYPTEVSPLARKNDKNEEITDRFEFFIAGRELANGFSELNDPIDQAERFKKQAALLAHGDNEAMHYDAEYIAALEYGLPPTAGEGIGIDRLVMFFTDSPSIRDVILFPLMRRESGAD